MKIQIDKNTINDPKISEYKILLIMEIEKSTKTVGNAVEFIFNERNIIKNINKLDDTFQTVKC